MKVGATIKLFESIAGFRHWLLWAAALLPLAAAPAQSVVTITYAPRESATDIRYDDILEIIETALTKTSDQFGPARMVPARQIMNEARAFHELEQGRTLSLAWGSTSVDRESRLLPIRIPLRKGLLSWRLCLIDRELAKRLPPIASVDDLRRLRIGQGVGWGDIEIYRQSGIKVISSNYESLFSMLSVGRFDLFPRGINEAFGELQKRPQLRDSIEVAPGFAIYYPWPYYLFVNRRDTELASRLETGLERMIKDGSFDTIFFKYNAESIKRADLHHRKIIKLENPLLPPETPLQRPELWFDPFKN